MAITAKFHEAPQASLNALHAAAAHMESVHQIHMARVLRTAHGAPDEHLPHPVYHADLGVVAAGNALSNAERVAWRYLTSREGNAAIEVHDRGDEDHEFSNVNSGPFVAATHEGLAALAALENVPAGEYFVGVLRILPLYVFALWLRADGRSDIIIPIGTTPPGLESGRAYSAPEFDRVVMTMAEAALKSPFSQPG